MKLNEKIIVTGGSGMVGNALKDVLGDNTLFLSSTDCDLRNFDKTISLFKEYRPEYVFHLAAKVGGIVANTRYVGDFYRENSLINTNVLEACRLANVKKTVSLLSTCVYPDECSYPLSEKDIHNGPPHHSNFAYAYAKRMLDVQSRAYRNQYGCNFITAVPNNLFGEHDNYHLFDSHVIPAIIHKMFRQTKPVHLWGDGSPLREFTYSKDLAKILVLLLLNYDEPDPINVGNIKEYSIKDVALKIKEYMGFKGDIIWDTEKPSGQLRKPSSNSKLLRVGWDETDFTDFDIALRKSCEWFSSNYPHVRGVLR